MPVSTVHVQMYITWHHAFNRIFAIFQLHGNNCLHVNVKFPLRPPTGAQATQVCVHVHCAQHAWLHMYMYIVAQREHEKWHLRSVVCVWGTFGVTTHTSWKMSIGTFNEHAHFIDLTNLTSAATYTWNRLIWPLAWATSQYVAYMWTSVIDDKARQSNYICWRQLSERKSNHRHDANL